LAGEPPYGAPLAGEPPYGTPPLVLVAHGSRDPAAAATAEDLAGLVRERALRSGLDGLTVRVAYLGHAAPSPGQVLDSLPGGPVVVLPLLLTHAYHSKTEVVGRVLRYTRTFEIKDLSVPVSKAEQLRDFYRIIASDERNSAVLKRVPQ